MGFLANLRLSVSWNCVYMASHIFPITCLKTDYTFFPGLHLSGGHVLQEHVVLEQGVRRLHCKSQGMASLVTSLQEVLETSWQ